MLPFVKCVKCMCGVLVSFLILNIHSNLMACDSVEILSFNKIIRIIKYTVR
jgi:hypothetical protein